MIFRIEKSEQPTEIRENDLLRQRKIAGAGFLLAFAAVALIVGYGTQVTAQTAQEEAKMEADYEKEFAANLNKAGSGDANAQYWVGREYQWRITKRDAAKAMSWYEKAAMQGHADAQQSLGRIYYLGKLVPKEMKKAVFWLQKSAAKDQAEAQYLLGHILAKGDGVPKDTPKAIEWFKKAAVQGHPDAQNELGSRYQRGDGVGKDIAKAIEWWQKAASEDNNVPCKCRFPIGNERAQYNLGVAFEHGEGVPKDAAKAVEWYQKAAVQGMESAQANLGRLYALGSGVPRDEVLGYAWANLASSSGGKTSVSIREYIERLLSPAEKAEAQRLSSNWKEGRVLVREGKTAGLSSSPGIPTKQGTGTAFLVGNAGQAITNFHVIDGCREVKAEGRDGAIKVVTSDTINDLALLQMPVATNPAANIVSDPTKLRQGEDIVVFGFPLNSVLSSGGNLTPGVVSALTGLGNNSNQIQITAPIQPGSSGSPVLNKTGEVVGVVSMKLSDSKMAKATGQVGQTVNFAVNGQTLKTFLDAHKIKYSTGGYFSREKSTADLADEARKWTLVVECWK